MQVKELPKYKLDKLNKEKINDYRYEYLYNCNDKQNPEHKRYAEELSIYLEIRFKRDAMKRYQSWMEQKPHHRGFSKHNPDPVEFLSKMLNNVGKEKWYNFFIHSKLKELNFELKFIKMDIDRFRSLT